MMPRQIEHSFQSWVDRFLDRVVTPPMFTTGIDHAARDMRNIGRVMKLQGRGIRFGVPDVFVAQPGRTVWLELKRGSKVSSAQAGIHTAMERAGQPVFVCSTMQHVLLALRAVGFDLHGNADNLAIEYEERVTAEAPKKKATARKRTARSSPSDTKRWAKIQASLV